MYRSNRGFTLVELLVVITIIGILMALLIPVISTVREQGRQTVCLNNQMNIGKALLAYETTKGHLPGVINVSENGTKTASGAVYTWFEAIFPYLDRADLWTTIGEYSGGTSTTFGPLETTQKLRLNIAVCPDDPYLSTPTLTATLPSPNNQTVLVASALLSYGVNDGFFVSYGTLTNSIPTSVKQGLDRNGYQVAPAVLSKLTTRPNKNFPRGEACSNSTTIMLGERTGDGSLIYPRAGIATYPTALKWIDRMWNPASPTTTFSSLSAWNLEAWNNLTFYGSSQSNPSLTPAAPPANQTPANPYPWPISPNMMVSSHPGIVCVVFFDGNGQKLSNDAMYPQ